MVHQDQINLSLPNYLVTFSELFLIVDSVVMSGKSNFLLIILYKLLSRALRFLMEYANWGSVCTGLPYILNMLIFGNWSIMIIS